MIFRSGSASANVVIGMANGMRVPLVEIEHQARLVDLHPFRAFSGEFAAALRHRPAATRSSSDKRIERGIGALGELQERDRSDQHRPGLVAERLWFLVFSDRLARGQA